MRVTRGTGLSTAHYLYKNLGRCQDLPCFEVAANNYTSKRSAQKCTTSKPRAGEAFTSGSKPQAKQPQSPKVLSWTDRLM